MARYPTIIINLTLIPILGIEGAAIATLLGYVVSDIVCVIVLCRMKLMVCSPRFIMASIVMAAYLILWRLFISDRILMGTIAAIELTCVMLCFYKSEIKLLIRSVRQRKGKTE